METIDDLDFDETSLPGSLRPLVPYYRRYAFSDDVIRERLIQEATPAELEELVQIFTPLWPDVNGFLDLDSRSVERPGQIEVEGRPCNPSERFAPAD
jgi:hypothetical protein